MSTKGKYQWPMLIRIVRSVSRQQEEREAKMEAALPTAIEGLVIVSNADLLTLLEQNAGSVFWPKENELRNKFYEAVKTEILLCMEH